MRWAPKRRRRTTSWRLALRGLGESAQAQKEFKTYQDQKASDESKLEASMKASQADDDMKADKVQDAIGHYKEAIAAEPNNANFKYKLALALHQAGDADGERAQLEQAVQLNPRLARCAERARLPAVAQRRLDWRHSALPVGRPCRSRLCRSLDQSFCGTCDGGPISGSARRDRNGTTPGAGQRAGAEAERSLVPRCLRTTSPPVITANPI